MELEKRLAIMDFRRGLSEMKLPSREECMRLLREHNNPKNIIEHSLLVADVAVFLAKKIRANRIPVNVDLVERAALLHDVAKFETLSSGEHHGDVGAEILEKEGYPEIALIAKEHALYKILEKDSLKSLESRIIFYVDKRVKGDAMMGPDGEMTMFRSQAGQDKGGAIVSLDDAFAYLRKTYGHISKESLDSINNSFLPCKKLEEELFALAKTSVDLEEFLRKKAGSGSA